MNIRSSETPLFPCRACGELACYVILDSGMVFEAVEVGCHACQAPNTVRVTVEPVPPLPGLLDDCLAFIRQVRDEQEGHGEHGDADYIHRASVILARAAIGRTDKHKETRP